MALAQMGTMDAPLSSRTRKLKATSGNRNSDFVRLVERTTEVMSAKADDGEVEEVRRILAEVRQQYDQVHLEAERREAELTKFKEAIRVADMGHDGGFADSKKEDLRSSLDKQMQELTVGIERAQESRKVYQHMCGRIQKEQALLKEKLHVMEGHLDRKSNETSRKAAMQERLTRKSAQVAQELEGLEQDIEFERTVRYGALQTMQSTIEMKSNLKKQRQDIESWRKEIALEAANQAFNASAGRLRKLYAIEKLAGNCLQKITFEQVERNQNTQDGFQKIREVTGLNDVMDIVHKFLSREEEHEQLKSSVKEAENRRELLREQFERFKQDTNGMVDPEDTRPERSLFEEVEKHEEQLSQALNDHEQSRVKLQQSTLQVEHMKRWANRVGRLLREPMMFLPEELSKVDKPADLEKFSEALAKGIDKFIAHIVQLISSGKVQRKNMSQAASKEYHEARRLLADKDFLKANCRVPASLDATRPASRDKSGDEEKEQEGEFQQDRADRKAAAAKREKDESKRKKGATSVAK